MTFSLTSSFEDEFVYQGGTFSLDLSFDNVLTLFEMFDDDVFSDSEKEDIALEILLNAESYENVMPLDSEVRHSLFLYIMSEFLGFKASKPVETNEPPPVPDYDFKKDAQYIYTSFIQAYQIDLIDQQGKLHWNKFFALFNNLPGDTIMARIRHIRTAPLPKDAEQRREMQRLKEIYDLRSEQEQIEQADKQLDAFASRLKG